MEIFVGILAMFVAFAALWLSSVAMKKSEDQFTELAGALRAELKKQRGELERRTADAAKRVTSLENRLNELQNLDKANNDTLNAIRAEILALKSDLTATQTALPPNVRRRAQQGTKPTSN